jgi:hypothetical protein
MAVDHAPADSNPRALQAGSNAVEALRWPNLVPFLLVALVVAGFSIVASTHYIIPWYDEVSYIDPGANLYFGRGFTATTWLGQKADLTFSSYPPLGIFAYYPWFKVFGFSLRAARSMNVVIMIGCAAVLVWTCYRARLVTRLPVLLALFTALITNYSLVFNMWTGRIDTISILVLTLEFAAILLVPSRLKYWLVLLAGVLVPFIQVQAVIYSFAVFASLFLLRQPVFHVALAHGAGMVIGLFGLVVWFHHFAHLDQFVATVTVVSQTTFGPRHKYGFWRDQSLRVLLGVAFLLALDMLRRRCLKLDSLPVIALGLCAGIAAVVLKIGGYISIYLTYMLVIPLLLCLAIHWEQTLADPAPAARWHRRLLAAAACVVPLGFALYVFEAGWFWQQRDHQSMAGFVQRHIQPGDVVFADPCVYYAITPLAKKVYYRCFIELPGYIDLQTSFSDAEKRSLNKIVVAHPFTFQSLQRHVGGEWRLLAEHSPALRGNRFELDMYLGHTYKLAVYERIPP